MQRQLLMMSDSLEGCTRGASISLDDGSVDLSFVDSLNHGAAVNYVHLHKMQLGRDKAAKYIVEKSFKNNSRELVFYSILKQFNFSDFIIPTPLKVDKSKRLIFLNYIDGKPFEVRNIQGANLIGRVLAKMAKQMNDILCSESEVFRSVPLLRGGVEVIRRNQREWNVEAIIQPFSLTRGDVATLQKILFRIDEIQKTVSSIETTFCHNDIKADNIIFRPNEKIALIDWADCGVGPAGSDIGGGLRHEVGRGFRESERRTLLEAVVSGYVEAYDSARVDAGVVRLACHAHYVTRFLPRLFSNAKASKMLKDNVLESSRCLLGLLG